VLLVVVALGALVYVLAKNAPGPTTTVVPADNSIAALGVNGAPSPADYGGNPLVNQGNQVRLDTSYRNTQTSQKRMSKKRSGQVLQALQGASDSDTNYLTNSDSGGGINATPDGVPTVMSHQIMDGSIKA